MKAVQKESKDYKKYLRNQQKTTSRLTSKPGMIQNLDHDPESGSWSSEPEHSFCGNNRRHASQFFYS